MKEQYMSCEQLYKYLHLSKRKTKYLLENGYIPVIDTGKKTHRYMIKCLDAESLKMKLDADSDCLSELKGKFGVNGDHAETLLIANKTNSDRFGSFLNGLWEDVPDALMICDVAALLGYKKRAIAHLCERGKLECVIINGKRYCSKKNIIAYASSVDMIAYPFRTELYSELIAEYLKTID